MQKKELNEIHELLLSFIAKLPLNFLGNLHTSEDEGFEDKVLRFLEKTHAISSISENIISHQFPLGTRLYASNSKDFCVLTNYEDHFLIFLRFKDHSLQKSLRNLENLMKIFEKSLQELSLSFATRAGLGFLTLNPSFCGTGVSLCYFLEFREKPSQKMQLELESQ